MKHAIDARGKKMGGETPLLCATLVGRNRGRLLADAAGIQAQRPDIVEWRIDHFEGVGDINAVIDTARALRAQVRGLPVIATCRSVEEGGDPVPIDADGIVDLYSALSESRLVDFIDFEMGNDRERVRRVGNSTRTHGVRLILSYHNLSYTPGLDYLIQRFLEAERLGADVAKVAVMPRDRMDVLTLLAATAQADAKAHIPLISMSMGPLGAVTRMIGGLFGSGLTFAVGESSAAPGHVPIRDLVTVHDIIRRSRGGEMY